MENKETEKLRELLLQYNDEIKKIENDRDCAKKNAVNQFTSKKSILEKTRDNAKREKNSQLNNLASSKQKWSIHIDKVHEALQYFIDGKRKSVAVDAENEYKEILEGIKKPISLSDTVPYYHEDELKYAFRHPFSVDSMGLKVSRSIFLGISVIWLLLILCGAVIETYHTNDASLFFSSPIVYLFLLVIVAYGVITFVWHILAAIQQVKKQNNERKAQAEWENNKNRDMVEYYKRRLKEFEKKFESIYKVDNQWKFDANRTIITRDLADQCLKTAIQKYERPSLPDGILKYDFEINYDSL